MIIDKLVNAYAYFPCHPQFKMAFEFLQNTDLLHTKVGRYNIDGDNVFALVQNIETKPVNQCMFESHRDYIDIQYIISDEEIIGYSQIEKLIPAGDYNKNDDSRTYTGTGNMITFGPGEFAVFSPQDGHMPGICSNEKHGISKKVVLKVRCLHL
ncbi:MAG: YhcH/YjgK/YiaL family protein [Ruminiclostridium sp.]